MDPAYGLHYPGCQSMGAGTPGMEGREPQNNDNCGAGDHCDTDLRSTGWLGQLVEIAPENKLKKSLIGDN